VTAAPELMAVVLGRELRDGETAIIGAVSALPLAACRVAQLTHAPDLWFITGGSGAVNAHPRHLPESSCDQRLLPAETSLPLPEIVLLEGRGDVVDVFFAGGLQIDARGNCNLVVVGDWSRPRLRGPGGVGLSFLPRAGRAVIYTTSHTPRTFVERVDFVSGPGVTAALVVTPLCTLDFDPQTRRMRLRTVHRGVTVEQVRAATGFELAAPDPVPETPDPTPAEMAALRRVDPLGVLRS
jgi:glutaconate CoA-transferase, subunit B